MANLSSTVTHPAGAPRPEDAMWSALAALLVAAIAICLFIIQVVMIVHLCKWIHRANANVRGFGAQGLNFTPGWAVGWFFVPLANLLLPYQAVVEIWKASRSPAHWQEAPIPNLVGVWWLLWLLFNATSVVMGYLAQNAVTIAEHRTATIVTIVVSLLAIGAITALVNVVSRIYRFQCDYVNGQP
jgi:hypothetical protein